MSAGEESERGRRAGRPRFPPALLYVAAALIVGAVIGGAVAGLVPSGLFASRATAAHGPAAPLLERTASGIFVPDHSPYRQQLTITAVEPRLIDRTLALPASVETDPSRVVNVLPPLGGRVVALKVGLGDRVSQGQPLVVIESGDLAQAYSDLDKAQAQSDLTGRALARAQGLTNIGGGSVKDLESAENDAAQAKAELARAQTRLKTIAGSARLNNARTFTVSAPASGVVTALAIAPGAYINDPTHSMMTISNLDRVWVTAFVPEMDTGFVQKGQKVDVTFAAYPGESFEGTVLFVSDVMEPDTRRTKVRIGFANQDNRLKPNMFATVRFHAPPRETLVVPDSALLMNNDSTTVFVETQPWTFTRRVVSLGRDQNGETTIDRGLSAGDRVVSRGGILLND